VLRFRDTALRIARAAVAALFAGAHAAADTLEGKVVKVADGDTVTVLVGREQHRVRLQGIDAPER
jgi:endonuclease YncB( thermonuclease family)